MPSCTRMLKPWSSSTPSAYQFQHCSRSYRDAGEDWCLALGVPAGVGTPQLFDKVEELRWAVGLEGQNELLVVQPEGVSRVYLDLRILVPNLEVFSHDALPVGERNLVPLSLFDEGVDEEVLRVARDSLGSRAFLPFVSMGAEVGRPFRHREV